jgi:hypothetical protein
MGSDKTQTELLEEISGRLNKVIGLLAIQGKAQDDQIDILTALGFDSKTAGLFIGMSGDAVRKRRSDQKKKRQKIIGPV